MNFFAANLTSNRVWTTLVFTITLFLYQRIFSGTTRIVTDTATMYDVSV